MSSSDPAPPPPPPPPPPPTQCYGELAMRHNAYSRKQKSLGLLCTNFIGLYNRDGVDSVGLDEAAARLGVERRRIYDIVNVLESVGVLARKAKNRYSWIGFSGIPKALEDLKEEALKEISSNPGGNPFAYTRVLEDEEDEKSVDQDGDALEDGLNSTIRASSTSCNISGKASRSDNRREKSLGQLTQNFVKLFLTTEADTISLDEAARLLLSEGHDSSQMRNKNAAKVRRLYDIANVLSSMNLIEKTQHAESRKPAFRWLGLEGRRDNTVTVVEPPIAKQWNKRTFGADISNVVFKRPKVLSMADEKPRKVLRRNDDIRQCNLTAQRQLQGSKSYIFGPFQPIAELKCENDVDEKEDNKIQDWEALASSFRFQYHNQALHELFAHYMEAWKSWYVEVAQGGNGLQPCSSIIDPFS